jgi:hypothetical protein
MANIALGPRAPQPDTPDFPIPGTLSGRIRGLLEREHITSCAQWLALGRRRLQIFGLTSSRVREIDVAVAEALK